jgi:hypothetical protein
MNKVIQFAALRAGITWLVASLFFPLWISALMALIAGAIVRVRKLPELTIYVKRVNR